MDPPQVAPLSVEQRELRALSKQITLLAHFLTRETCEKAVQFLLPVAQEAVAASEIDVPEGLEDKEGMDLIEAILERRSGTTPSTKKRAKPKGKSRVDVVRDGDAAGAAVTPVGKDRRKSVKGAKPPKSGRDEKKPKRRQEHPPRKQRKVVAANSNSNNNNSNNNNNNNDDDGDHDAEEEEEHENWNCATHGSIVRIIRYGRRSDRDPTFGLFILARANGQGQKKPHTFFANRDSLAAVDNIQDKYKHKRIITALSSELRNLSKGKDVEPELERLLQGSTWGKHFLAKIAKAEEAAEEESSSNNHSSDSSSNSDDSDGGHDDVDK